MKRWSKRVVKVGGKERGVMVYDGSATNISQFSTDTKRSNIKKKGSFHKLWVVDEQKLVIDDPLGQLFIPTLPLSLHKTLSNPGKGFMILPKNSFDED